MNSPTIEAHIREALTGESQAIALGFAAFLHENGMEFERGTGYWEDKRYWMIKHDSEYVCFVLLNGFDSVRHPDEPEGWIVWSGDYTSKSLATAALDNHTKEIVWANVDFCASCGSCGGGTRKTIFGRDFDKVCRTTFRFDNPNAEAVECMKKLVKMRISDSNNKT